MPYPRPRGDWLGQASHAEPKIPTSGRGKGVACYMYGTGTGYITDGAHCFVQAQPDGSLNIGISSNELGQGFLIAMRQIAADTFGVPIEKVYLDFPILPPR